MKALLYILLACVVLSCETEVDPGLGSSLNVLVVDAWLTTNCPTQHINITRSQPYFDSSAPVKVDGATVTVTDLTDPANPVFVFGEKEDRYTWKSPDGNPLGVIGHVYRLDVVLNGDSYTSVTELGEVPPIDSIRFRLEEGNAFFDDLVFAEFFATDLEGINDTYWIKAWKNGRFLGKPEEIIIAYDAAFSANANNDGIQFIQPIRDQISPLEESRDGTILSPYILPDTLVVKGDTLLYNDGSIYGLISGGDIFFEVGPLFVNNNVPDDLISLPLDDEQFVPLGDSALYVQGDSVYVEVHSISNEAYFFLNQVIIETTREGGFGALFATPLANVSTNIIPGDPSTPVAGFFNIATVSSAGTRLVEEKQIRIVQ